MVIHIGWWVIPAVITFTSMAWAYWPRRDHNYYGFDIVGVVQILIACIVSLMAWLTWALAS